MELNNDIIDINDVTGFDTDVNDSIIKVIGVGGGGCNAVNYMYGQNIPNVNFVVCNTDKQALDISPVPTKLLIGNSITGGRGAGNVPSVGQQCAEVDEDSIRSLFDSQTEMVFITAGMGGGTGTGAGPVVARLAKEAGVLTIGIVTIPFLFEGERKIIKALDGANEMKQYVDALLVINNENLVKLYKDLNFYNAFHKADDTLANAARSISEIISEKCYINVDFQDVNTTLKDSGTAIIATAIGEGENRVTKAINSAIESPLLKTHDIYSSKRLLMKFMCWKDAPNALDMDEVKEIYQFTSRLPKNIDVKWGIGDDPSLGDSVKVTILASGFDLTLREEDQGGQIVIEGNDHEDSRSGSGSSQKSNEGSGLDIENMYGTEVIKEHNRSADKARYAVLHPSQFDDLDVIDMIEKVPTFNRKTGFNLKLAKPEQHEPRNDQYERGSHNDNFEIGANTISFS